MIWYRRRQSDWSRLPGGGPPPGHAPGHAAGFFVRYSARPDVPGSIRYFSNDRSDLSQ